MRFALYSKWHFEDEFAHSYLREAIEMWRLCFTHSGTVETDMITHNKYKPVKFDLCVLYFAVNNSLKRHLRKHRPTENQWPVL